MNSQELGQYRDPKPAFDDAIAMGRLSIDPKAKNYAGNYMYMHTDSKGDHFKNINTRKYDV